MPLLRRSPVTTMAPARAMMPTLARGLSGALGAAARVPVTLGPSPWGLFGAAGTLTPVITGPLAIDPGLLRNLSAPSLPSGVSSSSLGSALAAAASGAPNAGDLAQAATDAASGAESAALGAAQQGLSDAANAANAAAMDQVNKLGLAPAVVAAENGDYLSAATDAGIALLHDFGFDKQFADATKLIETDAARGVKIMQEVLNDIQTALPIINDIFPEVASALAAAIGVGATVGSAVPIVGTVIGVILGALVALGDMMGHDFPVGTIHLTSPQFYGFVDEGKLSEGENGGLLHAAFGAGTADNALVQRRLAIIEHNLADAIQALRTTPDWQKHFLAIYVGLLKNDAYAWWPVTHAGTQVRAGFLASPPYQHRFADELFVRVADEFADWWIQQPGWLTALGTLPVLPVYAGEIAGGTTDPVGLLHDLSDAAAAAGESGKLADVLNSKIAIPRTWNVKDHGPLQSDLRAMLAARIPGAIARAILAKYRLPPTASAAGVAANKQAALDAAKSTGSSAIVDAVKAGLGGLVAGGAGGAPVPSWWHGPGSKPPGASPPPPPQFGGFTMQSVAPTLSGDFGSIMSGMYGLLAAHPPTVSVVQNGQIVPSPGGISLATSPIGGAAQATVAAAAAGNASAQGAIAGAVAGAKSGDPAATTIANTLSAAQKVQVQASFVAKWFGADAAQSILAGWHVSANVATSVPGAAPRAFHTNVIRATGSMHRPQVRARTGVSIPRTGHDYVSGVPAHPSAPPKRRGGGLIVPGRPGHH